MDQPGRAAYTTWFAAELRPWSETHRGNVATPAAVTALDAIVETLAADVWDGLLERVTWAAQVIEQQRAQRATVLLGPNESPKARGVTQALLTSPSIAEQREIDAVAELLAHPAARLRKAAATPDRLRRLGEVLVGAWRTDATWSRPLRQCLLAHRGRVRSRLLAKEAAPRAPEVTWDAVPLTARNALMYQILCGPGRAIDAPVVLHDLVASLPADTLDLHAHWPALLDGVLARMNQHASRNPDEPLDRAVADWMGPDPSARRPSGKPRRDTADARSARARPWWQAAQEQRRTLIEAAVTDRDVTRALLLGLKQRGDWPEAALRRLVAHAGVHALLQVPDVDTVPLALIRQLVNDAPRLRQPPWAAVVYLGVDPASQEMDAALADLLAPALSDWLEAGGPLTPRLAPLDFAGYERRLFMGWTAPQLVARLRPGALRRLLQDPDQDVRVRVVGALARSRPAEAVPAESVRAHADVPRAVS